MRTIVLALLLLPLAGCITDSNSGTPPQQQTQPDWQIAAGDPFFDGAAYDANTVNPASLSAAIYTGLPVEQINVETSDGMNMHNAVYRPDTTEPVPVFINFSPYWGDTAETKGDGFSQYLIDNFVPRGYAVVLSAIRGTGHSEGCFEVGSDRESLDLSEVVDFFAEQPWSNGAIGAGGKSYDSTSQNGAIAKFPTGNLRTIFHVSGITDMYSYTFYNGLSARVDSAAFQTTYSVGQGQNEGTGADNIDRIAQDATCAENLETVSMPGASTATGAKTPYWQERDWPQFIADSPWEGSIFFYHGFHDWNVQPAHILPWLENLPEPIQVKTWLHQDRENGGHLYPMRNDWNLTMLQYLDSELKGMDTGFWAGNNHQLQGSDRLWRTQENWPEPRNQTALELADDGTLLALSAADEAMRFSGAPTITVRASATGPDPVFSAKLYDVAPDGTQVIRNEAVMRLIYLNGLEAPSPVTLGESMTFTVRFYPSDDVLQAGHKWQIVFQESPEHSIAVPVQLASLTVDTGASIVEGLLLPASEGVLANQPSPTPCHAC